MKILLVADQPGWIFHRHCEEIKKRITEHKIDIAFRNSGIKSMQDSYDLIYVLDPIPLAGGYPNPNKTIMGLRCEFLHQEHPNGAKGLYENGFPGRCVSIKDKCFLFHVVNRNMLKMYEPIVTDKPLMLAQHGVDHNVFDSKKYPFEKRSEIVVGIAGRLAANKGGDILVEACKKAGVRLVSARYEQKLTKEQMPSFYRQMDVYICVSKSEGLHNPSMEAGAMSISVISTRCGAAEELIKDGENGILIDRNVDSLFNAIMYLKEHPETMRLMGENMYNVVMKSWTWDDRIEDFRKMFLR